MNKFQYIIPHQKKEKKSLSLSIYIYIYIHTHKTHQKWNIIPSLSIGLKMLWFREYSNFYQNKKKKTYIYKLWDNEIVYLWMTIYMLPTPGVEYSCKELLVVTCMMQSSSNELSILVVVKYICKQRKIIHIC